MASTFSAGTGYNPGGFQSALAAGQSYYAPEAQNYENQRRLLSNQLGYNDQSYNLDRQILQQQMAMQQAQLGADMGTNQIDLAAAQRLLPYYDQLLGLSDQMLASQMKGFGVQEDQSRLAARQSTTNLMNDAAARGNLAGVGTRVDRGFIDESLYNQLAGIMEQKNQATIGNTKEKLGLYENKAQANDRIARLGIEAQALGVKESALKSQLSLGLQKLGVQHLMSANDILDALNSNDYNSALLARSIYNDAISYGNQSGVPGSKQKKPPLSSIPPGVDPQVMGYYATGGY